MGIKKYVAATMQKALKQIREELGDDAIIVSNRKLPNGRVEISVSIEDSTPPPAESKALVPSQQAAYSQAYSQAYTKTEGHSQLPATMPGTSMEPLNLSNEKAKQLLAAVRSTQQTKAQENSEQLLNNTQSHSGNNHLAQPTPHSMTYEASHSAFLQNTVMQLQQELYELRMQMQKPAAEQKPVILPVKNYEEKALLNDRKALAIVRKKWQQVGLNDSIFQQFTKSNAFQNVGGDQQLLWRSSLRYLKSLVPRYTRNPLETPGVYAFVGPTGAGKTTTLAKLAVRHVNRWGADNVGIVTMDSFRIGAWEQMQRLGDVVGVKTALCRQEDNLTDTLSSMRDCKFILIDTAGLSHQDERRLVQWQKLSELGDELETYLVAPANLQASVLQQLTQAYEPARIRGMIYTKCDEITSLGEAVSALVMAELPWVFACDGQRIPDDIKAMSVDSVMQMLATTAQQKRWRLGAHASEQEALMVKALG